jgi:hypothetical protein
MKIFLIAAVASIFLLTPALASAQSCTPAEGRYRGGCSISDPITTVPEPGVLMLLSSGLLGLGGFVAARRRKENQYTDYCVTRDSTS